MSPYKVHKVEAFGGSQVIVWLADESTGALTRADGTAWCLRVRADAVAPLIADLLDAYGQTMGKIMVELAAGGCTRCKNTRRVNTDHLASLMGGDPGGEACPVCMPRAQAKILRAAHLPKPTKETTP